MHSRRRYINPARVIQRTTSETMRIEPAAAELGHRPANLPPLHHHAHQHLHHAKKAPAIASSASSASFVVTGVSSTRATEPESPDDSPEEFSRQTDIDTPSFSEDTSYSQYTEDADYCACEEIILKRCVNAVMSSTEDLLAQKTAIETLNQASKCSSPIQIIAASTTSTSDTHTPSPGRFIGRFQVVKVESIHPFRRGRWKCHDYVDNSEYAPRDGYEFFMDRFVKRKELEDIKKKMEDETFIFESIEDDIKPVTIVHNTTTPLVFMNAPVLSSTYHPILRSSDHHTADSSTYSVTLMPSTPRPIIRPGMALPRISKDCNDNTLYAVYCFIKNFIGVSSCTSAVIDAKIERAMDMSHSLMYAMQEEVEVLNKQIVVLVDRIKQLEVENAFLKSNASPDVLRALNNGVAPPPTATASAATILGCGGDYEKDLQKEDLEVAAITANGNFFHY